MCLAFHMAVKIEHVDAPARVVTADFQFRGEKSVKIRNGGSRQNGQGKLAAYFTMSMTVPRADGRAMRFAETPTMAELSP